MRLLCLCILDCRWSPLEFGHQGFRMEGGARALTFYLHLLFYASPLRYFIILFDTVVLAPVLTRFSNQTFYPEEENQTSCSVERTHLSVVQEVAEEPGWIEHYWVLAMYYIESKTGLTAG